MFNGENVLASAGVAYRNPGSNKFSLHIPENPASLMIDSGGFQAATRWNGAQAGEKGLPGRYPYSVQELHRWAESIGADIVAGRDVACERAVELFDFNAGHVWPGHYKERLHDSLKNQIRQQRIYEANHYSHDLCPVVQGLQPEEYEHFIQEMDRAGLLEYDRLAVGTVCKRSDLDEILSVLLAIHQYISSSKWVHLFGATLNVRKDPRFDGLYDSTDTAAWNYGADSKQHKKKLFAGYKKKVNEYSRGVSQSRVFNQNE